MKFELEEGNRGITDEDLLEDMRRCAKTIARDTVTQAEYERIGRVNCCTIRRRFGSWFAALERAGLRPSRSPIGIADEELFQNIKSVWIYLGRQPRYREMISNGSLFAPKTYENRFGSWSRALKRFVAWVNCVFPEAGDTDTDGTRSDVREKISKRRTRRELSDRQRFRILVRDGFRCTACGASPLTQPGVELHVDHLVPWSKGGETTDDNLATKCKQCNLGKGNAFDA